MENTILTCKVRAEFIKSKYIIAVNKLHVTHGDYILDFTVGGKLCECFTFSANLS